MRTKRKRFSLPLALIMCLGLAAPALAAGTPGLSSAAAKAYADVLNAQIREYGILQQEGYDASGIQYAGLTDMDADGAPELIIIRFDNESSYPPNAYVGVWRMRNGAAQQTANECVAAGNNGGRIGFARKGGQIRLYYDGFTNRQGHAWDWFGLISADGTIESDHREMTIGPDDRWESHLKIDTSWKCDETPLAEQVGGPWEYNADQTDAVYALQASLLAQSASSSAAPTKGYGSFEVSSSDYNSTPFTVRFEAAMVQERTVTFCDDEPNFDENINVNEFHSVQKPQTIKLIVVKPNSNLTVTSASDLAACGSHYTFDGKVYHSDAYQHEVDYFYTGTIEENLWYEPDTSIYALHWTDYYIALGPEAPAAASTPTGFTDVSAGDYFAAPVAWAVEKGITNGTGNNQFSPGQNCTNAQILTFLWRAYGEPEPSIRNPFTNSVPEAYRKAAIWAYEKGMVSGSAFDVNSPCTRAMAVKYMWQAAGSPTPAKTAAFTDVPTGAAFASAVSWAVEQGVTSGTSGTTFSPNDICTRGHIVTFLHRDLA